MNKNLHVLFIIVFFIRTLMPQKKWAVRRHQAEDQVYRQLQMYHLLFFFPAPPVVLLLIYISLI